MLSILNLINLLQYVHTFIHMIIYIHIFTNIHWWDNVSFYKKTKPPQRSSDTLSIQTVSTDTAGSVAGYENTSTRHWIDHGIYETRRDNTRWMLIRMHNIWPKTRFPLIRYSHIPSANTHFNMHFLLYMIYGIFKYICPIYALV